MDLDISAIDWRNPACCQTRFLPVSLPRNVHTGYGVHRASYSLCVFGSFTRDKTAGTEVDRIHPSTVDIKNL